MGVRWEPRHRFGWSNWTFGVWWDDGTLTGRPCFGIDIGPLELLWRLTENR